MQTYKENIQNLKDKIFEFYKSNGENEQLNRLITESNLDTETIQALLRFHSTYTTELISLKQFNHRAFNIVLDEIYNVVTVKDETINYLKQEVTLLKAKNKSDWTYKTIFVLFVIMILFSLSILDHRSATFAVDSIEKVINVVPKINKGDSNE